MKESTRVLLATLKTIEEAEKKERRKSRKKKWAREYYLANQDIIKEKAIDWKAANPEMRRAANQQYIAANPEKVKNAKRKCYIDNPEKYKSLNLKRYGIDFEQWKDMLLEQGGCCKCCGTDNPGGKNWHVDHCHDTGKVRGILCWRCNVALGQLNEDPEHIRKLATYAEWCQEQK